MDVCRLFVIDSTSEFKIPQIQFVFEFECNWPNDNSADYIDYIQTQMQAEPELFRMHLNNSLI